MAYKDHAGRVKQILFNGIVVGEHVSSGDMAKDAAAARAVLVAKGLVQEISKLQAMFNQAHAFSSTAAEIHGKHFRASPFNGFAAAPFVVNAAFSIELFLKTLYVAEGQTARGHKLVKLYDGLPGRVRQVVDALAKKFAPEHDLETKTGFRDCLAILNDAYRVWRYLPEVEHSGPINIQDTIYVMRVLHEACSSERARALTSV